MYYKKKCTVQMSDKKKIPYHNNVAYFNFTTYKRLKTMYIVKLSNTVDIEDRI